MTNHVALIATGIATAKPFIGTPRLKRCSTTREAAKQWDYHKRRPPKDLAYRRRRAADVANCRSRKRRGVELFKIEIGDREKALAIKFECLKANQVENKDAVSAAISRLWGKALAALLNASTARE